jgi:hypothetical protein
MAKMRWAAVALVLAVGCSSGGGGQGDETRGDRDVVELTWRVVGPGGFVATLRAERHASTKSALGMQGIVDSPGLEETRAATDEKLDAVARSDGGDVLPPSEEIASVLETLRQEVDAVAGPGASLTQSDRAREIDERYREVGDQYRAAGRASVTEGVDDPAVREGLDLQFLLADVSERESEIIFLILVGPAGGAPADPEETAELSRLAAEQRADVEVLQATDREPYRSVIESSFPEEHYESVEEYTDRVVNGESASPADLIGGISVDDPSYWGLMSALREAVEAQLG